ncbi:hypothetical protein ACIA8I_32635 [Streptomyces rishiriensis]
MNPAPDNGSAAPDAVKVRGARVHNLNPFVPSRHRRSGALRPGRRKP